MRRAVLGASLLLGGCVSRLIVEADDAGEGGQDAGDTADDETPDDDDGLDDSASGAGGDLPAECDVESHESDCDGDGLPDGDDPLPEDPGPGIARTDVIYVHSSGGLYTFSPETLAIDRIATFTLDGGFGEILDIAIDRFGVMYAVNFSGLFVCDPGTAACTTLASVSSNSLGIVPPGVIDDDDVLLSIAGATVTQIHLQGPDATVVEVGAVTPYSSSGDVATLVDGTTVFTSPSSTGTDVVVMLDPANGVVLGELGPVTGSQNTWGLATWGGTLWAADAQGSIWRQDAGVWSWVTSFEDQGWGAAAHPDAAQ